MSTIKMQGRSRRFDARVAVLQQIFSWKILTAISLEIRQGGFSLSPCLNRVRLFGRKTPAFQVIEMMNSSQWSLNHQTFLEVLQYGIYALEGLIRTGRASLLDMDLYSGDIIERLLHLCWFESMRYRKNNETLKIPLKFLENMKTWGITAQNHNAKR
jgi:hypothetical protein